MKRKKTARIVWISIAAVLLFAVGLICVQYLGLKPILHVEFGEPLPDPETVGKPGDRYAEEYGALPIGDHVVKIVRHGIPTPILVKVRDTVAPTAEPREQTIPYGAELTPDRFITHIRDASVVAVSFSEPFDFDRVGDFPVTIVLKDTAGNGSAVESAVHIVAVTEGIALEAGAPVPKPEAFLINGVSAELITPLTEEMLHHVGEYPVRFLLKNGQTVESKLTVSDTVAPTGVGTSLWIRPDEPLLPEMLVTQAQDETDLTYTFALAPDTSLMHAQNVTVRMTDEGGNSTDVESSIAISRIEPTTIEASSQPLSPELLGTGEAFRTDEPFIPDKPGMYTVPVTINGKPDFVLVTVVDTTPPTVTRIDAGTRYTHHPASPDVFFAAEDLSEATLSWVAEPDWALPGEQTVRIHTSDLYGNAAEYEDVIELTADTEPPVLYGVINRSGYVGEPIVYLAEVYAEDAVDGRVKVTVDSQVQPDKAGKYTVVYIAEDASGNRTEAECKFTLVKATTSEEEVRELARGVIEQIITDDMVKAEQLKAVFDYVRGHVHYTGDSDKSDWRKEAARGFKTGRGDCFTFYSVTRALLDELGVEDMSLTRLGARTRHYWVIVNIGTGWYHFDPTIAPRHKHKCFMWTNEQCKVKSYFWRYDHTPYPDIATERFDYDEVVRMEKEGLLP